MILQSETLKYLFLTFEDEGRVSLKGACPLLIRDSELSLSELLARLRVQHGGTSDAYLPAEYHAAVSVGSTVADVLRRTTNGAVDVYLGRHFTMTDTDVMITLPTSVISVRETAVRIRPIATLRDLENSNLCNVGTFPVIMMVVAGSSAQNELNEFGRWISRRSEHKSNFLDCIPAAYQGQLYSRPMWFSRPAYCANFGPRHLCGGRNRLVSHKVAKFVIGHCQSQ